MAELDDVIVVAGYLLPCRPKSNARNGQYRAEEDLVFGARDTLEDLRTHPVQAEVIQHFGVTGGQASWLMLLLRPIAKHYGVDKDELLDAWSRHYGASLVLDVEHLATRLTVRLSIGEPSQELAWLLDGIDEYYAQPTPPWLPCRSLLDANVRKTEDRAQCTVMCSRFVEDPAWAQLYDPAATRMREFTKLGRTVAEFVQGEVGRPWVGVRGYSVVQRRAPSLVLEEYSPETLVAGQPVWRFEWEVGFPAGVDFGSSQQVDLQRISGQG